MKLFYLDESEAPDKWVADYQFKHNSASPSSNEFAVVLRFSYQQTYLPGNPKVDLLAIVHWGKNANGESHTYLGIVPFKVELEPIIEALSCDLVAIKEFAASNHVPLVNICAPWQLAPVEIPKPWGKEIWYTGIEARGQAAVRGEIGVVPLPWILAIFPQGRNRPLILLKVLDPLPDEVYGDLYFELHEEKQEVYVVTHVDSQAWPDRVGRIQLGFDPDKRREFADDEAFKKAYLASVERYRQVRCALDKKLDELRLKNQVDLQAPVPSQQMCLWIEQLAKDAANQSLMALERSLRNEMNGFINHLPLVVGDTLAIPQRVPHALQHGVRVVEFQTPVYERKILSFAQKVLTQSDWDTEQAMALVDMDLCARIPSPTLLIDSDRLRIEQIVAFNDFDVQRIWLKSGLTCLDSREYSLVMPVVGTLRLVWNGGEKAVPSGGAYLLPTTVASADCRFVVVEPCLFLLATPK